MHTVSALRSQHRSSSRLLGALVLAVALLPVSASGVWAQDTEPRFTAPEPQSAVPLDEPFTVAGTGCAPGSTVRIEWGQSDPGTETVADDRGAFSATVTVPGDGFDPDAVPFDLNEFNLRGSCEGARFDTGPLVPDFGEQTQVRQVPSGGVETGAGGTAGSASDTTLPLVVAVLLVVASLGVLLRRAPHSRRP